MKPVIREEQTKRLYCPLSILVFVNIIEMEIDEFNQKKNQTLNKNLITLIK